MRELTRDTSTSYRFDGNHVNGTEFEPVFMFGSLKDVRIRVASTGTTNVESSISSIAKVKDGTANWTLESAVSGVSVLSIAVPVTAIRLTGANAEVEILAT